MILYDISQEIFSTKVYPGDPVPKRVPLLELEKGMPCNLTELTLGSHSGSHIDAPSHYYKDGKTIDKVSLNYCVGPCKVVHCKGEISKKDVENFLADGTKRLLMKGDITITIDAARKMTQMGLLLIGVEGLTVGPVEAPAEVHLELLGKEVVILENILLKDVKEGTYVLIAVPLNLEGVDGSPCRPLLIQM